MAISLAFALLKPKARLPAAAFTKLLKIRFPDSDNIAVRPVDDKPGLLSATIGESEVILTIIGAPYPWSDLEGPCATSLHWENASDEVRACSGHMIITVMNDFSSAVKRAEVLTHVSAAVLESCPEAAGLYWGNAAMIWPREKYLSIAPASIDESTSVILWVDVRINPISRTSTSGFTCGLRALDLMEFEVTKAPEPPSELYDRLMSMADYLIENGPVIKDGDTVGATASEKIKIRYGESQVGFNEPVMHMIWKR
jgi:hypothetical protein